MKTVLIFTGLVALTLGYTSVPNQGHKFKTVDAEFISRQKKVLSLFERYDENDVSADFYKAGKDYSIEANLEKYTNKSAVEDFLTLYKAGFLPKDHEFSIFYERMRDEAIALFHVFFYAKDFETFYNTAAWAKLYMNEGQFLYAYYIAGIQRPDLQWILLPAPYELFPQYFFNMDVFYKQYAKDTFNMKKYDMEYGVVKEQDSFVFYSNYSSSLTYPNEEQRLSYLTEDIGWNSYYFYYHTHLPFWWSNLKSKGFNEIRGDLYFYFYQQLLARYGMERYSNGLGDIPEFSWYLPLKTGYYPQLRSGFAPFAQRSNYYDIHSEKNFEPIRFLDAYEKTFFQYLQQGQFKAFDKVVDFTNPKASNFVGNYWEGNSELYTKEQMENYQQSYEITARQVLGASPKSYDKYAFLPSALDFYQTSLRDPAFYQLYQRVLDYFVQFKQNIRPYSYDELHSVGLKINDVKVDKLMTYFDYFDFNVTNRMTLTEKQLDKFKNSYLIRQPRLNHEDFTFDIEVKSDVATDAVIKIFVGPKYDANGYPINIEKDWLKFYTLDWFVHKLNEGVNKVTRKSSEFWFYKDDSVSTSNIWKYLEEGKVPFEMSNKPFVLPRRLMLPKGNYGGYPVQFFVFVYPYNSGTKGKTVFETFVNDGYRYGYPLDRPVNAANFKQPNMFFKDSDIYHKGERFPYQLNTPAYISQNKS